MKKKMALFLVMVMLVNMIAWADTSTEKKEEDEGVLGTVLVILALVGLVTVLIVSVAEADAPDDGVKLASMETVSAPEKSFGSFIKLLQHVEFGQKQNGDIYAGFRFQF
ncbi:hypothetical protein [Treponema sp. R80B11-R83G3]